jgi:hypothetical protein
MSNQVSIYSLTKLFINTGSGFLGVPGITDITFPGPSRKAVDTTNMDSAGFTEIRPANLATLGSVSATIQANPSNTIHQLLTSRTWTGSFIDTWQLLFSSGNSYFFSGSVTEFSLKAGNPADGLLMGDLKIAATTTFIAD